MLSLGEFPAQSKFFRSANLLRAPQTRFHLPSIGVTRPGSFSLPRQLKTRVFSLTSSNQKRAAKSPTEIDSVDGADDSGDEDDGDVFLPLRDSMKIWHEKKPRGFGEGEVYDTSIEDKVMEEIEQSRRAQLVNINKLKNSPPLNPAPNKKQINQEGASEHVRVRLINLPKKRNVDRDLRSAFKEFPGIVKINPVVSGKAKTRDPTCKGIAFIDFKSEDRAHRFVQTFSGKSIGFGKVQKHIKCVMMNSNPANSKNVQFPNETGHCSNLAEADWDGEVSGMFEGITNAGDEERVGGSSSSSFSAVPKKTEVNEKKKKVERGKKGKSSSGNPNILGSAKRLKVREKVQLTGALAKYGLK
ncbi:hypothetical protein DM860_000380 [Cuscuta australis]|uniref:RRM domain-containing protein n=1 Tax=Cuscuta australis TaxID=267555 RepID=A0A328CX55_9ASTE|nr:hypothetical protein DM860_000380 [Cuscuta australis]